MRINKLNYEVYAIDYIDGTLPDDLKAEMEQFLLIHPDIAKDVALFGDVVFVPDHSVKYMGKQDLKRPIQFAIMDYMNWIVPICFSIAFMVAYPYIRTLWHSDEVREVPVQEVKQEASINNIEAIPTVNENVAVVSETDDKNISTAVTSMSTASNITSASLANSQSNNIKFKSSNPQVLASKDNSNLRTLPTIDEGEMNSSSDRNQEIEEEHEGQSIVDFGYNVMEVEEEIDFLSTIDNEELAIERNINTAFLDGLIKDGPKLLGYMTITLEPLSVGYDMAKTTNINSANQLIRNLGIEGSNGEIIIGEPLQSGIEIDYHISDLVKFGSGFKVSSRNITYQPSLTMSEALNIQYRTYIVPATATLKMPLGNKFENTIQFSGGVALHWMGERNYRWTNHTGGIDLEREGTASLFNAGGNTKLITTNDAFKMVSALQFGLAYHKELYQYGGLTFGVNYNRQMSNINSIRIYDYDADTQFRSNETSYRMRFETVNASIKYTLPYKWRLTSNKIRS